MYIGQVYARSFVCFITNNKNNIWFMLNITHKLNSAVKIILMKYYCYQDNNEKEGDWSSAVLLFK